MIVVETLSCASCQKRRTTETVVEVGVPQKVDDAPAICEHVFSPGCCNVLYRQVSVLNG